jgi:hypothetical protein
MYVPSTLKGILNASPPDFFLCVNSDEHEHNKKFIRLI